MSSTSTAEVTATLRILELDQHPMSTAGRLINAGFDIDLTSLSKRKKPEQVKLTQRGLALALRADQFDGVIIGNNEGVGVEYARAIPEPMRARTLIVYDYDRDQQPLYEELGFECFYQRVFNPSWFVELLLGVAFDPDLPIEVIAVASDASAFCVKQGEHYFDVQVGEADQAAYYRLLSEVAALSVIHSIPRSDDANAFVKSFMGAPIAPWDGLEGSFDEVRAILLDQRNQIEELQCEFDPQARAIRAYLTEHSRTIKERLRAARRLENGPKVRNDRGHVRLTAEQFRADRAAIVGS